MCEHFGIVKKGIGCVYVCVLHFPLCKISLKESIPIRTIIELIFDDVVQWRCQCVCLVLHFNIAKFTYIKFWSCILRVQTFFVAYLVNNSIETMHNYDCILSSAHDVVMQEIRWECITQNYEKWLTNESICACGTRRFSVVDCHSKRNAITTIGCECFHIFSFVSSVSKYQMIYTKVIDSHCDWFVQRACLTICSILSSKCFRQDFTDENSVTYQTICLFLIEIRALSNVVKAHVVKLGWLWSCVGYCAHTATVNRTCSNRICKICDVLRPKNDFVTDASRIHVPLFG